MIDSYDAHAVGYARRLDPTLARAAEWLAEFVGAGPGVRALDVATGTGGVARAAARRGASVVGVDPSPGMLGTARELAPEIDLLRADAESLPFADAAFDVVTCGLGVSHFADPEAGLREIVRVLHPGGRFAASSWAASTRLPTEGIGKVLDRCGAAAVEASIDEETWESADRGCAMLRHAGFADVSVSTESFGGAFADPEEALGWALSWPVTAARFAQLEPERRERCRRECLEHLTGSDLTWVLAFNFFLARTTLRGAAMRPPVPPFTDETARQKVQAAENAWNTCDPARVAGAYSEDSQWRNRSEFFTGRAAIVEFLRAKWERELDYALRKDLWAFTGNRIAVRSQYECRDATGQWWRCYGNEQWEFDDEGYVRRRDASINDVPIDAADRRIFGARPESERGVPLDLR